VLVCFGANATMLAQPCRRCVKRWSAIQPLPTAPRALFASVAGRSHDFRSVVQPQRGQGVLRPTTGVFHQFRELHASSDSAAPTDKTHHNGSDGDGGADADADDTNGANNRGRQSTQTRRVVKVAALKDVVAALRPALLRIHPDAVARFPDKVASTNQRSVQTLQGLLHSTCLPVLDSMPCQFVAPCVCLGTRCCFGASTLTHEATPTGVCFYAVPCTLQRNRQV